MNADWACFPHNKKLFPCEGADLLCERAEVPNPRRIRRKKYFLEWAVLFCFEPFFVFRSEMSRKRDCWTFGVNWRSPFFVLLELKYVEQVHLSGLSLDLMRCLRFSQRTTFPWAKFTLGAWESPDFFPRRVDYTIAIIFSYDFNVTAYKGSARVPALVGTNNTW